MPGLIGKKVGMTSVYDEKGNWVPCTIIQALTCYVTQIRRLETDGYEAVQLAAFEKKASRVAKPLAGHFKKAGVAPMAKLVEFKRHAAWAEKKVELGESVRLDDLFQAGDLVRVTGTSKGKGFQGVVKRHNFSGAGGGISHGQQSQRRSSGSVGAGTGTGIVYKNKRMAGRMGGRRTQVSGLSVLKQVSTEKGNFLLVKGAVPGPKNGFLILQK